MGDSPPASGGVGGADGPPAAPADDAADYLRAFDQGMAAALRLRRAMGDAENARGIYEVLMLKGEQHMGEGSMHVCAALLGLCSTWEEERSSGRRAHAPQAAAAADKLHRIATEPPEWLKEEGGAEIFLYGRVTPEALQIDALCHRASVHLELQEYDGADAKYQEALALAEGDSDKAASLRETPQYAMALSGVSQLRQSAALVACGATPSQALTDGATLASANTLPETLPPEAVALFKEAVGFGLRALACAKACEGGGAESTMCMSAHAALGDVYLSMRNGRGAVLNYARAAQIAEKALGEAHPETLRLRCAPARPCSRAPPRVQESDPRPLALADLSSGCYRSRRQWARLPEPAVAQERRPRRPAILKTTLWAASTYGLAAPRAMERGPRYVEQHLHIEHRGMSAR